MYLGVGYVQHIGCQPEKATVAYPACGLLNKGKNTKRESLAVHPPPNAARMEKTQGAYSKKNKKNRWPEGHHVMPLHAKALIRSRFVSRPYRVPLVRQLGQLVSLRRFYASVYDHNFPIAIVSLFWRYLAASTFFLHAGISLRPPSVTVLTHINFQSPAMTSLFPLTTPSSPHCMITAPSRSPNTRFASATARRSFGCVPLAHKRLLIRNVVSMLSHPVISRARLYEVIRWSGLLRCVPWTTMNYICFVSFFVCTALKADRSQRARLPVPVRSNLI